MSVLRVCVIILCIVLTSGSALSSFLMDRVVAVVNQEVITWSQLYRTMEADASPQVKALDDQERMKIFQQSEAPFLEKLIDMRLQLQEARRMNVRVSKAEVDGTIEQIKAKYAMDDDSFQLSLEKQGFTLEEYRRRLQEKVMLDRVVGKVIRSKIVVSDEDVEAYIKENKGATEGEERYRISQIFLKIPEQPELMNEVESKAAEILDKLRNGGRFEDLASQYSQDPSSQSGGDLGLIRKQDLNEQFREVISALKPGETSEPFWTSKGLHIIQLTEQTRPEDDQEHFEEIREKLFKEIFEKKYREWIKHLREHSFIEIRL